MKRDWKFRVVDILLIALMVLPLVFAMCLKVLTEPASEGLTIAGARIFFTVPTPIMAMPITEAQVNAWCVMVSIFALCLFLTHGIAADRRTARQMAAEWVVEKTQGLVKDNMEPIFQGYGPFVAAILAFSACSSLLTLLGLYPPTSDLNIVGGWAALVFILIMKNKLKAGPWYYIKGLMDPIPIMLPMNIIGEIATPISMSFRHYGNVLSGTVISALVAAGLSNVTKLILGWLPGFLGEIPFLQIGIPAVLSLYFDLFSGCMQAFIFAMLTMLYVSGGYPAEELLKRAEKRRAKAKAA